MAIHNQIRVKGFFTEPNARIYYEGTPDEKIIRILRTTHREAEGFDGQEYQDVPIFYDGSDARMRSFLKNCDKYDMVDVKGVINIMATNKVSYCPECGQKNVKINGTSYYVYPIFMEKTNSLRGSIEDGNVELPNIMLERVKEVSNDAMLIGTVDNDPELLELPRKQDKTICCRFRLWIERKYFIKSQNTIKNDYPWVYVYGKLASDAYKHLIKGSVVAVFGFFRNRRSFGTMECGNCGEVYRYKDNTVEIVAYSVEYLSKFITDEELALAGLLDS